MRHVSRVTCHLLYIKICFSLISLFKKKKKMDFVILKKYDFFLSLKKLDKVVELVGGGPVIKGAYPV